MATRQTLRIMICVLLALTVFSNVHALTYPAGYDLVRVPDPLSGINPTYPLAIMPAPGIGQPFFDHHFGTILTRVTQSTDLRQEYAKFDPLNVDQSMIILYNIASGEFAVYQTSSFPYDAPANRVRALDQFDEPRWDPLDPHIVWGLEFDGFKILRMNVLTGQTSVIKDFAADPTLGPIISSQPDLFRITTNQEGESSSDKRYWALCLQGSNDDYRVRYLFCWDRLQNQVVGLRTLSLSEAQLIDWVGMSPLGNWVLIGGDFGSGVTAGLTMADRQLTTFHRLAGSTAHSDVGLDTQGN
ncbi:MAG TPA: hypothetical protein ENO11_00975, partial [Desulfobacteraceae bacterium]|nr:hypothetical protein [Desulfobacteraceae bacterium]